MRIAFVGDSLTAGIPGSSYFAILRERLPDHRLINLGRSNDTAISLYRRIARLRFDSEPLDIAFLWVGVNDVGRENSWLFRLANTLRRQPRSKSPDEFRAYYQKTLDLLSRRARRVIAVAPLLKGEDTDSEWNRQVNTLAEIIEELTTHYERVEYLDLRPAFHSRLTGKHDSSYLQEHPVRIAVDVLTLWSDAQVDRRSAERGLLLTLDGVHLNSAGAELVAEAFLKVIEEPRGSPHSSPSP
jgi:lysophospholipase L1-like esterase